MVVLQQNPGCADSAREPNRLGQDGEFHVGPFGDFTTGPNTVSKRTRNHCNDMFVCSFNPPSGFVLFRSHATAELESLARTIVSIRQADLCCFEVVINEWGVGQIRFQSAKRICAVSKQPGCGGRLNLLQVSIRQADLCCFVDDTALSSRMIEGLLSIRQADLCCFEVPGTVVATGDITMVSIRQADLCCFEDIEAVLVEWKAEVSIRQADLCCFEDGHALSCGQPRVVSIRQADLCCFEAQSFDAPEPDEPEVSIRQADLCCFEGAPRVGVRPLLGVSIRQADLCCFEV